MKDKYFVLYINENKVIDKEIWVKVKNFPTLKSAVGHLMKENNLSLLIMQKINDWDVIEK